MSETNFKDWAFNEWGSEEKKKRREGEIKKGDLKDPPIRKSSSRSRKHPSLTATPFRKFIELFEYLEYRFRIERMRCFIPSKYSKSITSMENIMRCMIWWREKLFWYRSTLSSIALRFVIKEILLRELL